MTKTNGIAIVTLALLGGCGTSGGNSADAGNGGSGGSGGSSASTLPVPIDSFADEFVSVECALLVKCHLFSEPAFCPLYFGPIQSGLNSLGAAIASVKAGKVSYDSVAGRACLNAIGGATCRDLAGAPAPETSVCQTMFTGTLADGSRCISDAACKAGSFCASSPAGTGCDGTCTAGGTLCNDDLHCRAGQVCDDTMPTATSTGTCVAPRPAGAAGQPCGTRSSCQAGLYCSDAGATPTCAPIGQAGAACTGQLGGCADGLICVPTDSGTSASCMTPADRGGACDVRAQCGGLLSTIICDETTHRCVDAPTSGPCVGATLVCNPLSSFCDTSMGPPTCKPYLPPGATCRSLGPVCGLPGVARCVMDSPQATTGVCMAAQAPESCVP